MSTTLRSMLRQLRPAVATLALSTVLLGGVYPLVVTAVAQVAFGDTADGSLIEHDGVVVGSELIGQPFVSPQYFRPRPSAAGAGYDGSASTGTNLGPLNPDLLAAVAARVASYRAENDLDRLVPIPVDAVTSSGSGLDPHISIANARLQARRVASVRGIDLESVMDAIDRATTRPVLGVLGQPLVDVLILNLSLDDRFGGVAQAG